MTLLRISHRNLLRWIHHLLLLRRIHILLLIRVHILLLGGVTAGSRRHHHHRGTPFVSLFFLKIQFMSDLNGQRQQIDEQEMYQELNEEGE